MIQVMFYDKENQAIHGGLYMEGTGLFCGCCGGFYPEDEFEDLGVVIVEKYDTWANLDNAILCE